ncbi:repressor of yield of DENV protein homolog [Pomacea canaliculata]|uniref:repressor of yield of DENV protein homolog n=1 Tax=Pomacea canaliculata TaxID=400727 RepID=UPI000D732D71|nr:repressor of yield of DENV protein homolog [Pomacea canaliculata]
MIIAQTKMAAAPDDDQGDASRQDRKLQELFRGRFSLQEARELIVAKGGLEKAALFVLNGNPDEVTAFILHRRDVSVTSGNHKFTFMFLLPRMSLCGRLYSEWMLQALRDLREISATRVKQELTSGVSASIRLFACGNCNRYWWRKVPERKEVSQCHQCDVKYDPVPREHEWGLAVFECDCSNTFISTGLMNETVRSVSNARRMSPMREFLRRDQTIFRQVYYPSRVHHSTGSTVSTCLTQGDLQENYNFPIVLL